MQPNEIQMFLDDPAKSVVLGLPATTAKKNTNAFYQAVEIEQAGDRRTAERIYLELLNSDFDNPVLMAALGMNYAVAEKNGLAHLLLRNAYDRLPNLLEAFKRLGITPKPNTDKTMADFVNIKRSEIQNAIGTCYKHENHIDEARKWFDMAQDGIPINPDIQNNLGTLYINEGRPDKAYFHLREALRVDPKHAQAHWNLSLAMLEEGNYAEGWTEYNWGVEAKVRVDRNFTPPGVPLLPIWNGEKGARVVVYGEQGIGDEILFASMLPDLIADSELVVLECHKKLHKLFAHSFPTIDIYPTREDEQVSWPCKADSTSRYNFTHRVAIGSLGKFYRPSIESFPGTPYIHPTPDAELAWNERLAALGPGPKIGISWIGGHKKTRIEVRSQTLEAMLPILKQKGAHFISLQYTPQEDEIHEFEQKHGIKIHQFPEAVYSPCYNDTAGLVSNLDLVITVCTSLVHLASSMGVPTWVMVPSRPAWRYRLDLDSMPWYNGTVLFRMGVDSMDWTPVIAEVAANLATLLGEQNEIQVA